MFKLIAKMLYQYGLCSAGAASFHGPFEAKVPEQLKKSK